MRKLKASEQRASLTVNVEGAKWITRELINRSIWFEVFPLPFDNYRIQTRNEDAPINVLRACGEVSGFAPNREICDAQDHATVGEYSDCPICNPKPEKQ